MADWYPKAKKRQINKHVRSREGSRPNVMIAHVTVSPRESMFDYFSGAATCPHFHLAKDGTFEQYLPISSKSGADYQGNHRSVSVETQGAWPTNVANTELWTDEQVKALAELAAWLNADHDIPLRLVNSSHPGESGLGWHRIGIDGNFPSTGMLAGREERGGGEVWSLAFGKVCPGDAKIRQMVVVLAEAIKIAGGEPTTPSKPVEKPKGYDIDTDGFWGRDTTGALQKEMKTPVDGEVWRQNPKWKASNPGLTSGWVWNYRPGDKGSPLIYAMQDVMIKDKQYDGKRDGLIGPKFVRGLQKRYKTVIDGELWAPSKAIKAMQTSLRDGKGF